MLRHRLISGQLLLAHVRTEVRSNPSYTYRLNMIDDMDQAYSPVVRRLDELKQVVAVTKKIKSVGSVFWVPQKAQY